MHHVPDAARLAARRADLAGLDTRLTTACERAAARGQRNRATPPEQRFWSPAAWRRYLEEARAQDHLLGPRMRRLAAEIAHLERAVQ